LRVLITGITGFAGSHLAELCLSKDFEVYGTARHRSRTENIDHMLRDVRLESADVRDGYSIQRVISRVKPHYLFHLAAQSFVPESWEAPSETLSTNIIGCTNILEAIRCTGVDCKVQIAGSSEEYGLVYKRELPIKETNPLRPLSPYGISKVAEDFLGWQYWKSFGIKVVVTRAFNHTGPRRGQVFATSSFAKQVAEIEKGREPIIYVGNLDAIRDFTDVRDIVRGYLLALESCKGGERWNISSMVGIKIETILNILLGLSRMEIQVKQDSNRLRPSDLPMLVGDSSKFRQATGWDPTIPLEQTLEDLLNYWRERV